MTALGLGCNKLGRGLDEKGTRVVVDAALDAGITFFDTASNYGGGRSEAYLGEALGSRRREVVIATKFGTPIPGMDDAGGGAPTYIERMVERSLRQLRTDYIDLYQLHRPDPSTPIEATLETLAALVEKGKVLEIGCSNLDPPSSRKHSRSQLATGPPRSSPTRSNTAWSTVNPRSTGCSTCVVRQHSRWCPTTRWRWGC